MKLNSRLSKQPLSFRYVKYYTAGFVLLVLIFINSFFWLSDTLISSQEKTIIQNESDVLVEYYYLGGQSQLTKLLKHRLKSNTNPDSIYLLTNEKYQTIMGNLPQWPPQWPNDIPFDTEWGEIDWSGILELRYYQRTLPDGYHLLVGQINRQVEGYWLQVHIIFFTTLALTIILGIASGWFLHRQLQKRFQLIEDTCQKISAGQLSHRMHYREDGDELDRMAQTLNKMLDRIEQLMGGIQHVTNNIAHDLRTPLTRLRGRLELFDQQLTAPSDKQEAAMLLNEVDDLLSTFQSLLNISRIEAGQMKKDYVSINLGELCTDAIDLYEPLAEEKKQQIKFQAETNPKIMGDRDLLFQCFANILDNAIKYSPVGSSIHSSLKVEGDYYVFAVHDQGSGIPEAEFEKVFDRFYRVEKSRHFRGSGLGLSMVAAVVKLHSGIVELDNDQGLVIKILLPCD